MNENWSIIHEAGSFLRSWTGSRLIKTFPLFYATRRFITAVIRAHHLSLFWARSIQSMPQTNFLKMHFNINLPPTPESSVYAPHPTSRKSVLILSSHPRLGLPIGSFSQASPPKPCTYISSPPCVLRNLPGQNLCHTTGTVVVVSDVNLRHKYRDAYGKGHHLSDITLQAMTSFRGHCQRQAVLLLFRDGCALKLATPSLSSEPFKRISSCNATPTSNFVGGKRS